MTNEFWSKLVQWFSCNREEYGTFLDNVKDIRFRLEGSYSFDNQNFRHNHHLIVLETLPNLFSFKNLPTPFSSTC